MQRRDYTTTPGSRTSGQIQLIHFTLLDASTGLRMRFERIPQPLRCEIFVFLLGSYDSRIRSHAHGGRNWR